MGDTFGGEHHRLGSNGKDPQRGHSLYEVRTRAYNDNEPKTSCLGCFLFALTILAAIVAAALGIA